MPEQAAFKVAIVDDDAAIRRLVRLFLTRAGYDTLECTTGGEARERLAAEPWDLAILDRRLPDLDGVLLCHELKSNPDFRARYIIMLTGETQQEDKIEGLELGADDYITKPFQYPELLARIRAGKRIVDLQKELMETNRRLELLSITDGLTKLNNHRYFQDELLRVFLTPVGASDSHDVGRFLVGQARTYIRCKRGTPGDVDVQEAVANLFRESVRTTDLAARYGGEEFAVMMPETELDDAMLFAEKIRALIESEPIDTQAGPVPTTVSIGVASVPFTRVKGPKELIVAADKALYRAKKAGRNQVHAEKRRDSGRSTRKTPAA